MAANTMRQHGITVFVVGISGKTRYTELLQLAGGVKDHVFNVKHHYDIYNLKVKKYYILRE